MPDHRKSATQGHSLDEGTPDEIRAYFTRDAHRFPRHPHLNLKLARVNERHAAAKVRYLLAEEPAQFVGQRSQMAEWQEWGAALAQWVITWCHAAELVLQCERSA